MDLKFHSYSALVIDKKTYTQTVEILPAFQYLKDNAFTAFDFEEIPHGLTAHHLVIPIYHVFKMLEVIYKGIPHKPKANGQAASIYNLLFNCPTIDLPPYLQAQ